MLNGVDVSRFQAGQEVVDAARSSDFVIVKATEGLTYNDPAWAGNVAVVRRAGKLLGHYHYAWPEHDPIAEAKHFLAVARPRAGEVVALDLERGSAVSWARRLSYALAWLAHVKAATGASPFLYVNLSWARELVAVASPAQRSALLSYPLWLADLAVKGKPRFQPWPVWTCQQWNETGIDRDVFNGSPATWRALGVGGRSSLGTKVAGGVIGAVLGAGAVASGAHHPPAPHPVVKPTPKPAAKPAPARKAKHRAAAPKPSPVVLVRVRAGDTVSSIAKAHGTSVEAVARASRLRNPNVIRVGEILRVPVARAYRPRHAAARVVVVRRGDTLDGIARAHGTTWPVLAHLNRIARPGSIQPGQRIRLP